MNFDQPTPNVDVEAVPGGEGGASPGGNFAREWVAFLTKVRNTIVGRSQAGTTAQRPTDGLEIGLPYFDTSLGAHGKPIWCSQVKPAVVWVDATSGIV